MVCEYFFNKNVIQDNFNNYSWTSYRIKMFLNLISENY